MYDFFLASPEVRLKTIASGNSHRANLGGTQKAETMLASKMSFII